MKKLSQIFAIVLITNSLMAQNIEEPITTIKVGGVAEVYFTHQAQEKIRKVVTGKPSPEVIISFEDGVLTVDTKGEAQKEVVKVYVSSLDLENIVVEDVAQFHSLGLIKTSTLTIKSDDSGSADIYVDVEKLNLHLTGGDITVMGKTEKQNIKRSGDYNRGTLRNDKLEVESEGR